MAEAAEIKALESRMEIKLEAIQAILDDIAPLDPRAEQIRPQDLVDRRIWMRWTKVAFSQNSGRARQRDEK
jgi:hypothetical protein